MHSKYCIKITYKNVCYTRLSCGLIDDIVGWVEHLYKKQPRMSVKVVSMKTGRVVYD